MWGGPGSSNPLWAHAWQPCSLGRGVRPQSWRGLEGEPFGGHLSVGEALLTRQALRPRLSGEAVGPRSWTQRHGVEGVRPGMEEKQQRAGREEAHGCL